MLCEDFLVVKLKQQEKRNAKKNTDYSISRKKMDYSRSRRSFFVVAWLCRISVQIPGN